LPRSLQDVSERGLISFAGGLRYRYELLITQPCEPLRCPGTTYDQPSMVPCCHWKRDGLTSQILFRPFFRLIRQMVGYSLSEFFLPSSPHPHSNGGHVNSGRGVSWFPEQPFGSGDLSAVAARARRPLFLPALRFRSRYTTRGVRSSFPRSRSHDPDC
jgi:hypothetical protein